MPAKRLRASGKVSSLRLLGLWPGWKSWKTRAPGPGDSSDCWTLEKSHVKSWLILGKLEILECGNIMKYKDSYLDVFRVAGLPFASTEKIAAWHLSQGSQGERVEMPSFFQETRRSDRLLLSNTPPSSWKVRLMWQAQTILLSIRIFVSSPPVIKHRNGKPLWMVFQWENHLQTPLTTGCL